MTAKFDGKVQPGEWVVAIQGSLRLRAMVLSEFHGGPGQLSAISLGTIEVQMGNFPSGIEELTINANSWDIYRDSDGSAPGLSELGYYDELQVALSIFKSYGGSQWLSAEHDEIHAGPDPKIVSKEHIRKLEALGWHPDESYGSFYYFT